jgi:hypothetical protein
MLILLCFNQTTIHAKVLLFCFTFAFYYFGRFKSEKTLLHNQQQAYIVDGLINEQAWITNSNIATDFIMFEPDNGKPININKKTEVKVLYDNEAIYISAMLYDNEPNKIERNNKS